VGALLTETAGAVGLDLELSAALARWRQPNARHDPAKIVLDLAVTLALGGDCLADIALLRAEPELFGLVASDPTVSRAIDRLAQDAVSALRAINTARAAARARAWVLAGEHAPDHGIDLGSPLIIDVDATLVTAHSDKEGAAPTFKLGFGHHPLWAFCDHGPTGSGEPLSHLLRPGNAGSNTAEDHIAVIREALRQLPGHRPGTRPGRKILIRIDSAGVTHDLLDWIRLIFCGAFRGTRRRSWRQRLRGRAVPGLDRKAVGTCPGLVVCPPGSRRIRTRGAWPGWDNCRILWLLWRPSPT
jgi:DDE family transposase